MKRNFKLLVAVLVLVVMAFTLASCDVINPIINKIIPHEHEFSADWSSDATNHWHAAICEKGEECSSATADLAAHTFAEGACTVCGYADPNYNPECTEHAWGAPVVTKPATCTEDGVKTSTCTLCGATNELVDPALGHDEKTLEGKLPTCTEPGLSNGKQCSVCGEITKAQSEIAATGHTFVEGVCACGEIDPDYNGPKTYVLDIQSMAPVAQKEKADGESAVFADFFTIYYSAKFKLDGSNKTFEDGFEATQRLNWGGGTVIGETTKNAIMFTVDGTATVKVWWVCGGTYDIKEGDAVVATLPRQVGIYDAEGNLVAQTNVDETSVPEGDSDGIKNNLFISEFAISEAGTYYLGNVGNSNYFFNVEVVVTPVEEVETEGSINVETTDTYTMYDFDFFTFTATTEGYYTFKIPAGLGAMVDGSNAPEVDYYMDENGGEFTVGLEAGQEIVVWVSSTTRGTWTIDWSLEAGDVENQPDAPIEGDATELVVGSNTVVFGEGELSEGKTYPFVVTEEGTYTFRSDLMAVVMDADGNTIGRGQAYLVPGNYTVALFSMMPMPANSFVVNITFEAPATGEPNGSEQYPFVWETLPESVTFESDNMNMVYYVFTATADGSVTFTWAVEGNDWFNYFELVEGATTENNGSGFAKTSHTFVVEAGKTYRVGLGTWIEGGETVVSIAFNACAHVWSEATCTTLSTCSSCGATTGDLAEHTSSGEATCQNPEVCTVCGFEMSTVDHTWGEPTDIIAPDCSTMTDGSQKLTCTVCGHEETETLWAYHVWDDSQCVEATCTTNGKYHAVCTVCGEIESYDIEAQGHTNYNLSCGDTGECFECGETFTLDHTYVEPATCTAPGFCYGCNQTVGEALGHKYDETGLCTECYLTHTLVVAGSSSLAGSNWSLEDENNILSYDYEKFVFTITYENVALGHHEFKVIDVTNGYNWDVQYPTSNYVFFAVQDSKVVITVDLKAGTMTCDVYAPGSEVATDGQNTYLVVGDSALCGDVVNTENEGWGWEFENYANILTLNADGKYEIVYTNVPAGKHGIKVVKNFSWDNQWGGTGEGGNYIIEVATAGSIVTITFDPATGISHSVEAPHVHEFMFPCDAHCMTCGELVNENAAHTIVAVEAKAATCGANGNVAYWYCSDCGYAWTDEALTQPTNLKSVIIPATGEHVYTYPCDKICAACYELTNEAAQHTIVAVEAKAATCGANGNVAYWYCSDCGCAWTDEALTQLTNLKSVIIPATGEHDYDNIVTAPTCTKAGYTEHICAICDDTYTDSEVDVIPHDDANGDYKCDACSTKMFPADGEALTIPQALALAKAAGSSYTTAKYYITGIVTNVYNTQYGNLYLKDAEGNQICIYGLYTWDKAIRYDAMNYKPVEGDELTVYTVLGTYNSTAQGKDAWVDEVVAHEHDYKAVVTNPTCVAEGYTTHTCSICSGSYMDSNTEALGHTTEAGECERCGLTIGGSEPVIGTLATFDFGANGSATHADGNKYSAGQSWTAGAYTLKLTTATNVYGPARDAKGNSCIKMGTSSNTGSIAFTVGDDITEVVIYIAKYKSNTTKISVNGTSYTLTKNSNDGAYDVITIDTSVTKTVTLSTVSGGVRCMINTIEFNGVVA